MAKYVFILFVSVLICSSQQKEIFMDYGLSGEGKQLLKYFSQQNSGFYVDIGCYDPIYASNTLNLYTQGWGGVNVDASAERVNRFFLMRPDQTNLNFAIGEEDKFVSLYQLPQDKESSTNPNVKGAKTPKSQLKVPSLTLKQLCQRFFYRKPTIMNIGVKSYSGKVLQSNDWANQKCVPEFIITGTVDPAEKGDLPIPEQILKKQGYVKIGQKLGTNQLFVKQSALKAYQQKQKSSSSYVSSLDIRNFAAVVQLIRNYLKKTIKQGHYEPTQDQISYKFVRLNQVIDLTKQNLWNNRLLTENNAIKNRPLLVFHFNPKNNIIVMREGTKWQKNQITIQGFQLTEIKITQKDGKNFNAYVFNHHYQNAQGFSLRIFDSSKDSTQIQIKQYTPSAAPAAPVISKQQLQRIEQINKASNELSSVLKSQSQSLTRLANIQQNQTEQLKGTFTKNHDAQLSFLQKIGTNVQQSQKKFTITNTNNINSKPTVEKNSRVADDITLQINNVKTVQTITLVFIFLLSATTLTSLWLIAKKITEKQRSLGNIPTSSMSDVRESTSKI